MAADALRMPLAQWADRKLRLLAQATSSERIAALDGATILGERGSNSDFVIRGRQSAGPGGSRLHPTRDGGWFCLTILSPGERPMLPALFMDEDLDYESDAAIAAAVLRHDCADLVERGRLLGLPVASADEVPPGPPVQVLATGPRRERPPGHRPLVIDMSSIWAGPLAGHLLWLAGAEVIKVESLSRPELLRRDDPVTFELINQGKPNLALDFADAAQKAVLADLVRQADFVIESSRVRALKQLGIDAEALVREVPGLVWLSVTGHGATGEAAQWAGIGHDCGVAAGLARAMADAGGEIGYVGDAMPDPLTGITAALEGWRAYESGEARRIGFAMSAIAAGALREERARDPDGLNADLRAWSAAIGQLFPKVPRRAMLAPVREFGADNARFLPC